MPTTFCRLFTFACFSPLSRGRWTSTSLFTGRCGFLPKRMKASPNWWHWILFSVPAVSPHPASAWQTHHPSHRKSPLTGPAAASSWSSFIIPADWLAERRADRWGRSPAGDLAGAKPWRLLCMNGGPGRMGEESLSLHRDKRRLGVGGGVGGGGGGGGGRLLMHLAASPLQTSTGVTYAHLQKPQEERTAFQVEIPQRCAPEITPLIDPTMLTGGEGGVRGGGYFSSQCTTR